MNLIKRLTKIEKRWQRILKCENQKASCSLPTEIKSSQIHLLEQDDEIIAHSIHDAEFLKKSVESLFNQLNQLSGRIDELLSNEKQEKVKPIGHSEVHL